MPRAHKVKHIEVLVLEDRSQAFGHFCSAFWYWLTHPKDWTSWVFIGGLLLNVFMLINGVNNLATSRISFKEAKPIGMNESSFNIIPEAVAQSNPKADPILIDKQLYGYGDPDVKVWKLDGKPILLFHDKRNNFVFQGESEELHKYIDSKRSAK